MTKSLIDLDEVHGLVLLHYDADFDQIAAVPGQPTRWVAERGCVS